MGVSDAGELHDGNPPPCGRLPYCVCPSTSPSNQPVIEEGESSSSSAAEQGTAAVCVCVCVCPGVLTSWTRSGTGWGGGFGLVENAWGCPGRMADGSRCRSRQSDKVKPLPCTLTEVFHATAAWRQNPTKTAGIAFQTGMPVDNVRPPVISITIIPSGLGPVHHVPPYRQASFLPNPPLSLPGLELSTQRTNAFCYHQHILPFETFVVCCPAQCGPDPAQVRGQSPTGNAQWPYGHYYMCGGVGVRNVIRNHETTTETISSLPARSHCLRRPLTSIDVRPLGLGPCFQSDDSDDWCSSLG